MEGVSYAWIHLKPSEWHFNGTTERVSMAPNGGHSGLLSDSHGVSLKKDEGWAG